jgi:UDP-N-acetyl-D-glucosamine dehydrogenase
MTASLADRIGAREAHVVIVGQGYVGLPLAVAFAGAGFKVTGYDTDPGRVTRLNLGVSYIGDVPDAALRTVLRTGHYVATTDAAVLGRGDVLIVCVPTPLQKSKDPDISFVVAAAHQIAAHLHPGQLIVLESTTYPGTTEDLLLPMFEASGLRVGADFHLAFSPERIDPGNRAFGVKDIPKLVGGVTPACRDAAVQLYSRVVARVLPVSSPRVAELAKLYENVFRNVNIALANEFALMCRHEKVNPREVIDAAATKPFGFLPFYPGPGIGGHCIGIDPIYLSWKMRQNGYEARFIRLADEINRAMPAHVVTLIADALNRRGRCLNGSRILALGVSYKRGVADTRESPALEVLSELRERGADIAYADPHVGTVRLADRTLKAVDPTDDEVRGADCVVILTDHAEFDYPRIIDAATLVVDTRYATWGMPAAPGRVVTL